MPRYGRPPIDRVMEKVALTNTGCWEFNGARSSGGYGHIRVNGRLVATHRLIYVFHRGDVPRDHELDHLCRKRSCCNPEHLETVTRGENVRRGHAYRMRDECRNGHRYDAANTYVTPDGHRSCRTCNNAATRRYKERRRAA
jgi:hypothetical protein